LTANTDKYRIQKFVVDPNAKNVNPVPQPGVRPGVRPLPIQKIQPIRGNIQIQPLPAPVPLEVPQANDLPAPAPQVQPLPLRRE
jgi:hypothetical protein